MKPSFSWNCRRILPDDSQPTLSPRSPLSEAVEQCLEERRQSIRVLGYGTATFGTLFALCFLILGRMSVETMGPDTIVPINPQSASGFRERLDALTRENTLLIKELQKAQTTVEDLEELAARRSPEFNPAEDAGTASLPSNKILTTVAETHFTATH